MNESRPSGNILRSIGAVIAGVIVGAGLATITDFVMHGAGIFPKLGDPMADNLFYLAAAYRLVYSVLGSYAIALLAPKRPMLHAMIGGLLGLIASTVGAVVTWNHVPPLGPHWYPLSLVVTALPCAWLGGKLRLLQLSRPVKTVSSSSS